MLKKLLQTWLIGIVPSLLIVLVQSFTGKYEGENNTAWQWFFINTLPSILLISFVFFKNSKSEVLVLPERKFKLLRWISVLYIVIILGSLLLLPLSEVVAVEALNKSYFWLLPFQLLFIIMFSTAVFGKKLNVDEELFEDVYKDSDYDPNDIHSLLAHNQLGKAFDWLRARKVNHEALPLLENRYHKLQQDRKAGIVSVENARLEHNQIVYVLQEILKNNP